MLLWAGDFGKVLEEEKAGLKLVPKSQQYMKIHGDEVGEGHTPGRKPSRDQWQRVLSGRAVIGSCTDLTGSVESVLGVTGKQGLFLCNLFSCPVYKTSLIFS